MERPRPTATSWDTRAFVHQPLDTTVCRTPTPSRAIPNQEPHQQKPAAAPDVSAAAAAAATARPAAQLHAPAPRFTIRPPSRLLNGKYTQRERCSPPPNLVSATSSSSFESSSAYGTQGISGSDSDASMDAEVASLTSGRRLGNGVEGLLRMVDAPSRPRASQPRIRDAESAVSLFALLTPEHRDTQRGLQRDAAAGDGVPAEPDGGIWEVEPAAKRRRLCSSQVLDS